MKKPNMSDRAFGLTFAAVFAALAGVGWLAFDARPYWAVVASAVFLATALLAPWILLPLNRLWGAIAHRVGEAVNFVLLAAFFYLFVLPLGLVMRLFGHRSIPRGRDRRAKTYWTPIGRHTDGSTLSDMF